MRCSCYQRSICSAETHAGKGLYAMQVGTGERLMIFVIAMPVKYHNLRDVAVYKFGRYRQYRYDDRY